MNTSFVCILHIDTSTPDKTRVALEKNGMIKELIKNQTFHSSETILPLIETLLLENKTSLSEITEISVAIGPGSYTGLRVGAAVGQALGFVLGILVNKKSACSPIHLFYGNDPWNSEPR